MKFEEVVAGWLQSGQIAHKRDVSIGFESGEGNFLGPKVIYRPDLGRELNAVLAFVLDHVVWTEDSVTRDQAEHWGLPVFQNGAWRGDCDDFMAAFRLILKKLGWDEKILRRAVCFAPIGGKLRPDSEYEFNHAVLCVNFDKGLVFLDNRFSEAKPLSVLFREGYQNFSVLSAKDGQWHGIKSL
ncbi:MAG: transglutaminase-like cysteine peptidase [Candidatus Niyogibacteria bacterium]|nr:MAG: transglutaminase-like cysteine peptidase [Candidatus Niyogibacteria bacterium]